MSQLVSVILPVYNGGEFLSEAVESILNQDHGKLELLLIDDHSTDSAIAALGKRDSRLKTFKSKGKGVADAFNTGIALSDGSFVARMDADDVSLPARLGCQLEYLAKYPSVAISGCRVDIFSESGIQGGLERYQDWLNSCCTPEQVHQQIFIESPLPNPGLMFRREALLQLDGYRNKQWPEDYDLLLRADAENMQMGKPEPVLLRWREHETRLTHTDSLYDRRNFMAAKSHFLVHHRLKGRSAVIWGAGPSGRLIFDLMTAEGGKVKGFIEVHPRRIGGQKRGLPVWPIDKVNDLGGSMLIIAVGAAGARQEITAHLCEQNKIPGKDYLFVA
jgi:glycosyltransferase involved in cell wall biosynthesis